MKAEPEVFDLPAAATTLALGLLDDHYAYDLAIAAGTEVQIVLGRDRKLSLDPEQRAQVERASISRHTFASEVSALAVGDFTGEGQTDVAMLTADGSLQVMWRRGGETRGRGDAATRGPGEASVWQVSSAMSMAGAAGESPQLIATSVSPHWEDDLLLLGGDGEQMRVLVAEQETSYWKRRREGTEKIPVSPRLRVGAALDGAAVAALPMRLNMDGLSDVVVLKAGQSEPAVLQTEPTQTHTVNSAGDEPDATPDDGQCRTASGH